MFPKDDFSPARPGLQPLRLFHRLPCWQGQRDRLVAGEGGTDRAATPPVAALCGMHAMGHRALLPAGP